MRIVVESKKEAIKRTALILQKFLKKKPNAVLGLATGKTMIPLYKELASLGRKGKIDFSKAETFNLDEYANKKTFHNYMNSNFFNKINVSRKKIHFPSANGKNYEHEIKKSGGIDLCFLGIGTNGHIAFNEPGSSFASITRKVITSDKKSAYTMGIKTIMNSKKIMLLAFGKEKADAVAKAVKGKISEEIPASILRKHRDATFILDKSAAGKL